MNCYQQQVADIDRRHRLVVRGLVFVGAIALAAAALWAADLPILEWWNALSARAADATPTNVAATMRIASGGAPVTTTAGMQPAGNDSSIASTPQRLVLVSTSPGRNSHEGVASIGTNPQNPQTYVAGAILVNGAELAEIHSDRVVLQRDGMSTTLYSNPAHQNQATPSGLLTVGGERAPGPVVPTMRETLIEYIRPNPVCDADVIKGYEVYSGPKADIFARLGLKNGDLIVALDGMPFSDPQQAMSMFRQLTDGVTLVASLDRKGKRERIVLDGALIVADQARVSDAQTSSPISTPPDAIASR